MRLQPKVMQSVFRNLKSSSLSTGPSILVRGLEGIVRIVRRRIPILSSTRRRRRLAVLCSGRWCDGRQSSRLCWRMAGLFEVFLEQLLQVLKLFHLLPELEDLLFLLQETVRSMAVAIRSVLQFLLFAGLLMPKLLVAVSEAVSLFHYDLQLQGDIIVPAVHDFFILHQLRLPLDLQIVEIGYGSHLLLQTLQVHLPFLLFGLHEQDVLMLVQSRPIDPAREPQFHPPDLHLQLLASGLGLDLPLLQLLHLRAELLLRDRGVAALGRDLRELLLRPRHLRVALALLCPLHEAGPQLLKLPLQVMLAAAHVAGCIFDLLEVGVALCKHGAALLDLPAQLLLPCFKLRADR
mmetsp:Transcript_69149/g.198332  ORF Transcript_69149/g.198332 Transcript_69149/m.198332 type:complete len:349 (-) Transcript_69149:1435-2481(-)